MEGMEGNLRVARKGGRGWRVIYGWRGRGGG